MNLVIRRAAQTTRQNTFRSTIMHFHSYTQQSSKANMMGDYKAWRAMGEGGTSPTWSGYLSCISAEKTIAFKDTLSPDIYNKPEKYATGWSKASAAQRKAANAPFLTAPLPAREGPRSRAKRYVYPQRQKNADEHIDPGVKTAYQQHFNTLGETNAASTEWKTSALEKHGTALFVKQSLSQSPLVAPAKREICHIHTSDMSGHVTLSFADAQEVIAKGWGERHRLSGTDWIHLGYTMVYVPRTVEETEVLCRIFQAGVDFMKSA